MVVTKIVTLVFWVVKPCGLVDGNQTSTALRMSDLRSKLRSWRN
jgi:hypothetical protein